MDLGKMLLEAFASSPHGESHVVIGRGEKVHFAGGRDLQKVAEAFLAKVQETEGSDVQWVWANGPDGALEMVKRPK